MRFEDAAFRLERDPQGMLDLVLRAPQMVEEAWGKAAALSVPSVHPANIVAVGMGGSGLGGDLLRAILSDEASIPVVAIKDYRVPAFVGAQSLVFACSYSGNTEETLAAYDEAARREAVCVAITSGGELLRRARAGRHPAVVIPQSLPPRAALPYLFVPMLAVLTRMGVIRSFEAEVREAVGVLRRVAADHGPDRPHSNARRLAEVLVGRVPVVYSVTPFLEPAAQRWKDQMNENAKAFAVWNSFPELNHNETVGWGLDEALARVLHVIVLRDVQEPDRLAQRVTITRELAFTRAAGVDDVWTEGEGKLARLLSAVLVGDLVSWYLALLRGVDPTPVAVIDELKRRLAQARG